MHRLAVTLARLPVLSRSLVLGAMIGGLLGGLAGFIVGLMSYPPTAWFAVFEVGLPTSVVCAVGGLAIGATLSALAKFRSRRV